MKYVLTTLELFLLLLASFSENTLSLEEGPVRVFTFDLE